MRTWEYIAIKILCCIGTQRMVKKNISKEIVIYTCLLSAWMIRTHRRETNFEEWTQKIIQKQIYEKKKSRWKLEIVQDWNHTIVNRRYTLLHHHHHHHICRLHAIYSFVVLMYIFWSISDWNTFFIFLFIFHLFRFICLYVCIKSYITFIR